jgi:magnesium-transporting ATPase (P-type)
MHVYLDASTSRFPTFDPDRPPEIRYTEHESPSGCIDRSGVPDISLPGGFVDGSGSLRYAQTMAFTTLMLFQIFNVINARSDDTSAFVGLFTNQRLWAAMALSVAPQATAVYVPVLQQAFGP